MASVKRELKKIQTHKQKKIHSSYVCNKPLAAKPHLNKLPWFAARAQSHSALAELLETKGSRLWEGTSRLASRSNVFWEEVYPFYHLCSRDSPKSKPLNAFPQGLFTEALPHAIASRRRLLLGSKSLP